jgi:hypothetical protein
VAGDKRERDAWLDRAHTALKSVAKPDDRRPIEDDLKTIK